MKVCRNCHKLLEDSCFSINLRNKDGLHSYCKKCVALKAKEYNQTKGKEKLHLIQQRLSAKGYYRYGHGAFVNMQKSAAKRNVEFKLTEEELNHWWHSQNDICVYCGSSETEYLKIRDFILNYRGSNKIILNIRKTVFNTSRTQKISGMTIDRVNSNGAYETTNMVKSCWICNSLKSNKMSFEEAKVKLLKIHNLIKEEMKNDSRRNK